MSDRTDFYAVATDLAERFDMSSSALDRIAEELHRSHAAGQEGQVCRCYSCAKVPPGKLGLATINGDPRRSGWIWQRVAGFGGDECCRDSLGSKQPIARIERSSTEGSGFAREPACICAGRLDSAAKRACTSSTTEGDRSRCWRGGWTESKPARGDRLAGSSHYQPRLVPQDGEKLLVPTSAGRVWDGVCDKSRPFTGSGWRKS